MPFTFLPMSAMVSMRLSRLTPARLGRGRSWGRGPLALWPGSRSMNFSPRMPMEPRDTMASEYTVTSGPTVMTTLARAPSRTMRRTSPTFTPATRTALCWLRPATWSK